MLALTAVVAGACAASFDVPLPGPPSLVVTVLDVSATEVWPGQTGIPMTATIHNAGIGTSGAYTLAVDVFDATGPRADIAVEQRSALPFLAPDEEGAVEFAVSISTTAELSAFSISVSVVNETPDVPPPVAAFTFGAVRDIVVDRVQDDTNADGETTLREAILDAVATPGIERITFDAGVFDSAMVTSIDLAYLGPSDEGLPIVDGSGDPIVIDGRGRVRIEMNGAHKGTRIFGLRLVGPVTVAGLVFNGWEQASPDFLQFDNSCFGDPEDTGGAVQMIGGSGITLSRMTFTDLLQDYARSCWHAAVRIDGGEGHRIRDSLFEKFNGDAVRVRGGLEEISGTIFRSASNPPEGTPQESREPDSAVVVESLGVNDLRFVGNLVAEMDRTVSATSGFIPAISGVGLEVLGSDGAGVLVANNVFVRNEGGAVARRGGRAMTFANNVYLGNDAWDLVDGAGAQMRYETLGEADLGCNPSCDEAVVETDTFLVIAGPDFPLLVVSSAGESFDAWTPVPGSLLIDSGIEIVDRNGTEAGRFRGAATDRGVVEVP